MRITAPASDRREHPAITAITIQPAPSAFDRLRNTFATTPLPNSINMNVPMNSPTHSSTSRTPYSEEVLPGLMCLDFDQSLSDGNYATPLWFFHLGQRKQSEKSERSVTPDCLVRVLNKRLSLGQEVLSVNRPSQNAGTH
jgi:hypothetical protein